MSARFNRGSKVGLRRGPQIGSHLLSELSFNLLNLPFPALLPPEADEIGVDLKQRIFKTRRGNSFRLLFIVRGDTVHILAVRGAGQNLVSDDNIEIPE